jgi:hypothetical protein
VRPYLKNNIQMNAEVVEHLPSKPEALSPVQEREGEGGEGGAERGGGGEGGHGEERNL